MKMALGKAYLGKDKQKYNNEYAFLEPIRYMRGRLCGTWRRVNANNTQRSNKIWNEVKMPAEGKKLWKMFVALPKVLKR